MNLISRGLASLSLMLKQPLASFCEIETCHGDALITKQGDYLSIVRLDGMLRMSTRTDIERIATAMRTDIAGALEKRGHAIVGCYASDPDLAVREIERLNMDSCRQVAREMGIDLTNILDERLRLWSSVMRWEAGYYILWTQRGVLTKEERKQVKEEQAAMAKECSGIGDAQKFFLRSEVMAAHHAGFVSRIVSSLKRHDVAATELSAHDALIVAREAMYRETVGSSWRPILVGDRFMARWPEEDGKSAVKEGLLWPAIRDHFFYLDAVTHDSQRVEIGDNEFACVDLAVGPEDVRPFVELASRLGQDRIPWRVSLVLEGGGNSAMMLKQRQ